MSAVRSLPSMSNQTQMSPDLRRKNRRIAWWLGGFALFMLLSSVPFWKGLFQLLSRGTG